MRGSPRVLRNAASRRVAAFKGRRRGGEATEPGGYARLPHMVLRSPQFIALSAHATRLLVDLLAQYKGHNNGDLCASWIVMAGRNWRSRQTLRRALLELEAGLWITRTRQGGLHRATLYAITIFTYDPRATHDILPADFRKGAWATVLNLPARKRRIKPAGRVSPHTNSTNVVPNETADEMH